MVFDFHTDLSASSIIPAFLHASAAKLRAFFPAPCGLSCTKDRRSSQSRLTWAYMGIALSATSCFLCCSGSLTHPEAFDNLQGKFCRLLRIMQAACPEHIGVRQVRQVKVELLLCYLDRSVHLVVSLPIPAEQRTHFRFFLIQFVTVIVIPSSVTIDAKGRLTPPLVK